MTLDIIGKGDEATGKARRSSSLPVKDEMN